MQRTEWNAGCRDLTVSDPVQEAQIAVRSFYPTRADERLERHGAFTIRLAVDADVARERLALVAISQVVPNGRLRSRGVLAATLGRDRKVSGLAPHLTRRAQLGTLLRLQVSR